MIGNGQAGISKFNAIVTNQIENEKVFEEIVYSISKRLSIPSSSTGGGILDIVIDPTGCSCSFLVFLPEFFKAFGAGPINIDVYFGVDADDDGTIMESINRDDTSSETAGVVVRLNPTINDDAPTLLSKKTPIEDIILSNGVSAVATVGGEVKKSEVANLRMDGKYMYRLTNTENVTAFGHAAFTWFEVP